MIINYLPPVIFKFLGEIEALGFSLCLVGGIPRDYYFNGSLMGTDFDFEIRPSVNLENPVIMWPQYYKKLHEFLSQKKLAYTELPYLITRVHLEGYTFEFSSPRTEVNVPENLTHHHFKATLNPALTNEQSFKRRDFTINSIGVEFNFKAKNEQIIDPYHGLEDLKNGVLKNISDDFFDDSVRFLRLIRFKIKFNDFQIHENILNHLKKFNLSRISNHHFKEELFKSRPGMFLNIFSELVVTQKLVIPVQFNFLIKYKFPENLSTREELLAFVFINNESDAKDVVSFFCMPEKKLKDLKSFFCSYKTLKDLKMEEIDNLFSLPVEEALKAGVFKEMKNLEDKKEWRPVISLFLNDDLLIEWNDWETQKVTQDDIDKISPSLRSYYQFYKALVQKYSND